MIGLIDWREIPGFPDYDVSEDGEIRRSKPDSRGLGAGHILKSWPYSKFGHRQIKLFNGEHKLRFICIHQAVAMAFIGPKPPEKDGVAHNDGVAWHNHWSNLRWATHTENHADKDRHGTKLAGENVASAKLSNSQVKEIKQELAQGVKQKDLAARFGVHKCTIQAIAAGKNWKDRVSISA